MGEKPHHAFLHDAHKRDHDDGVAQRHEADAPVDQEDKDNDAHHQQPVADEVDDDLREELGQLTHVTVDTLDQFAGRAQLVEAHVEPQDVGR